jgi:hypothetical protein
MKIKINYIYIFLYFFSFSFSYSQYQNYYSEILKSNLTKNNDSIPIYNKKAIKKNIPFTDDLIRLSFYFYNLKEYKEASNYFLKAVKQGYNIIKEDNSHLHIVNYEMGYLDFNKENRNKWEEFLFAMYSKNEKKYKKERNKFKKTQINTIDNQIYNVLLSNEMYYQNLRLLKIDTISIKEPNIFDKLNMYGMIPGSYYLLDILKKGLFPDRRKCNNFSNISLTLLLNHNIKGFINKNEAEICIKLLWKEVERGNLRPYEYASVYDQYYMHYINDKYNYFGTVTYYDKETSKSYLFNLANPLEINQIRKEHFLEPIENTVFNLPKNYRNDFNMQ